MTRILPAIAVFCLAFMSLAQAGEPEQPRVLSATQILEGHKAGILSLAFHPEGNWLASAAGHPSWNVILWELGSGKIRDTLEKVNGRSVAFSPDGKLLAASGWSGTIQVWKLWSHQLPLTLDGDSDMVLSVAFSPDGKTLASGYWYHSQVGYASA